MTPKISHFLRRMGEILGYTLIDTKTGHRILRQIYRVGEFDDGNPRDTPKHQNECKE